MSDWMAEGREHLDRLNAARDRLKAQKKRLDEVRAQLVQVLEDHAAAMDQVDLAIREVDEWRTRET